MFKKLILQLDDFHEFKSSVLKTAYNVEMLMEVGVQLGNLQRLLSSHEETNWWSSYGGLKHKSVCLVGSQCKRCTSPREVAVMKFLLKRA